MWIFKSIFKNSLKKLFALLLLLGMVLVAAFFVRTTKNEEPFVVLTSATGNHTVGNRKIPIYCVETKKPQIALTFDAAWGNEETQKLLDLLRENDTKATFFMTGEWVEKYPEDVKKLAEEGHELGNHSWHHYDPVKISNSQLYQELMQVHEKVKELTGIEMTSYRPPYGSYNDALIESCTANGYYCIQWDVDSLDWKDYGVDSIVTTVLNHKHLGNGSIILMHNGSKYTADALEAVIVGLKEKGFELVCVKDLIYKENYKIDVEGRQIPNETTR